MSQQKGREASEAASDAVPVQRANCFRLGLCPWGHRVGSWRPARQGVRSTETAGQCWSVLVCPVVLLRKLRPRGEQGTGTPSLAVEAMKGRCGAFAAATGTQGGQCLDIPRAPGSSTSPDRCVHTPPPHCQPVNLPANPSPARPLVGRNGWTLARPAAAKSLSGQTSPKSDSQSVERENVCFHNLPQLQ